MSNKLPKLDDNFFNDPVQAINELIAEIVREREPYMVDAVYIKTECESVVLNVNGQRCRLAKNRCLSIDAGNIVKVDSRHLY